MFDFDRLDKLIHEKGRLAIMTLLAARPNWPFQDLKAELKMSDGNLITHLRTLQQATAILIVCMPHVRVLFTRWRRVYVSETAVVEIRRMSLTGAKQTSRCKAATSRICCLYTPASNATPAEAFTR